MWIIGLYISICMDTITFFLSKPFVRLMFSLYLCLCDNHANKYITFLCSYLCLNCMFASCSLFCYACACACIASDEQAFKHFWQSASLHNRCYCFHFSGEQKQARSKRGTPDTRNGGRCRKNNTCPHHCLFHCSILPLTNPLLMNQFWHLNDL